jgi:hypothetical protein
MFAGLKVTFHLSGLPSFGLLDFLTFGLPLSRFHTIFPYLHPFKRRILLNLLKVVNPAQFFKINL